MYVDHFGLNDAPFSISPNPRYLYMSEKHKEALAHLLYDVGVGGGFVLLTGEVGTGKTTVCRSLLEQLPENTDVAFILNPLLDAAELLESICDELSIAYIEDKTSLRKLSAALYRFLLDNHAKGRNTVLLIDEAQNLDIKVLELIRLLTNLETDTKKLLQIVFIGQPELNDLLAKPALRQLSQRITARFHIQPLSLHETQAYIRHRLHVAGLADSQKVFPTKLIAEIHHHSGGIPRLINILCDRMLLGAYADNKTYLDSKKLKQAAAEVIVSNRTRRELNTAPWLSRSLLLYQCSLGLLVFAIAIYLFWSRQPENTDASHTPAIAHVPSLAAPVAPPTPPASGDLSAEDSLASTPKPAQVPPSLSTQTYQSEAAALSALFQALGSPQLGGPAPCEDTEGTQWHCAKVTVKNWKGILQYNRPSILEFINSAGTKHYGVLLSVDGVVATLLHDGKEVPYRLMALGEEWTGDFTLVWQGPEGYEKPISVGDKGELVAWIAQKFADIDQQTTPLSSNVFSKKLAARVKIFQQAHNLQADGIVGLQTLLKINDSLGLSFTLDRSLDAHYEEASTAKESQENTHGARPSSQPFEEGN